MSSPDAVPNEQRRRFLFTTANILAGISAVFAAVPFISSWLPSAKTKAEAAPIQVDLSQLQPGQQVTVQWRGKPVWIIRRTKKMLAQLGVHENQLRDPDSVVMQQPSYAKNPFRSIHPEYLILIGICTHLGCTPKYIPDGELGSQQAGVTAIPGVSLGTGGFYCPCHGSLFDLAGRVYKGVPAPINLEVPPHYFINQHVVVIGEDGQGG